MAGPNDYYVTVEKPGYDTVTKEITIKGDEQVINESVGIEKESQKNTEKKQENASVQQEAKQPATPAASKNTSTEPKQTSK